MTEILNFINSSFKYFYIGHSLCAKYQANLRGYKDETGIAFVLEDIPVKRRSVPDRCCNKGKKRDPCRTSGIGEGRIRQVF